MALGRVVPRRRTIARLPEIGQGEEKYGTFTGAPDEPVST